VPHVAGSREERARYRPSSLWTLKRRTSVKTSKQTGCVPMRAGA
jgi:hypothetical protein